MNSASSSSCRTNFGSEKTTNVSPVRMRRAAVAVAALPWTRELNNRIRRRERGVSPLPLPPMVILLIGASRAPQAASSSGSRRATLRRGGCGSARADPVVAAVFLELGETEGLEDGGYIFAEAAAEPFLQAVPPTDRVVGRPSPRLDRVRFRRLLLIGVAQG